MHIISRRRLREFFERHPDSEPPLERWYKIFQRNEFADFGAVKATFPSADWVDGLVVFNIGGNKYRLIASIHFNRGKVYIRHILTHAEYDEEKWKL